MFVSGIVLRTVEAVGEVVGCAVRIGAHVLRPITLVVGNLSEGAVDRNLEVVTTEAVTMGVWVREQPPLQHLVRASLNAWYQVRRAECNLLHVSKVVLGVLVQNQLADGNEGEVCVGPDFGEVEWIEGVVLRLLECHDLDVEGPAGELTLPDGVVQIADTVVRVISGKRPRSLRLDVLNLLVCFIMEFAVDWFSFVVDEFEGMRPIPVHVTVTVRNAAVGKQNHDLVSALRSESDEIPEHVVIFQMRHRVSLLSVDEACEQQGVADEENRRVVAHQVPDSLISVELDGEPTGVPHGVGRTTFTTDRRESYSNTRTFPDPIENTCLRILGNVMSHLEIPKSSGSLGVNHTFRDPFTVKMCNLINVGGVLEKDRTARADGQ